MLEDLTHTLNSIVAADSSLLRQAEAVGWAAASCRYSGMTLKRLSEMPESDLHARLAACKDVVDMTDIYRAVAKE